MTEADLAPAPDDLDGRCVATLRMLAVDMVEAASSGHPGLPLGAAPMAWTLWSRFLRHDPSHPAWPDRDRFVLSAGHGSSLLYALLHLFGYSLTLEDLRAFRRLGSRTPGHPEHEHTEGVEVTTGPLGQGLAHGVGMALAERMAAARWNIAGEEPLVDHRTFVLCSDGDLMEGVSGEASSLAGHLGLARLVVLYDDNRISIDGSTDLAFSEDVSARYAAYGWGVLDVEDGNDMDAIDAALSEALADEGRPSFIRVRTTIGFGAPTMAGTAGVHGAPLGPTESTALRRRFGWPDQVFLVPDDVRARMATIATSAAERRRGWEDRFGAWAAAHPDLAEEWTRRFARRLPPHALDRLPIVEPATKLATRAASGLALRSLAGAMPELVGGSADLTESTCVDTGGSSIARGDYGGCQIHFGVREHAMAAVCNGIDLHGGFRAFASTFLVFSDYSRPALRLAALMRLPVVHLYTHDSVGLGEDGPTHQPIEHLASLRAIPGVAVLRPADANETIEAWRSALGRLDGPTVLALSRQSLPVLEPAPPGWMAQSGARIVREELRGPDIVLVATGSEVTLALAAAEDLDLTGIGVRVLSMPWRERFLELPTEERCALIPPQVPVLVVEAAVRQGWDRIAGEHGDVLTIERFGASGDGPSVQRALGFDVDGVVQLARRLLADEAGFLSTATSQSGGEW